MTRACPQRPPPTWLLSIQLRAGAAHCLPPAPPHPLCPQLTTNPCFRTPWSPPTSSACPLLETPPFPLPQDSPASLLSFNPGLALRHQGWENLTWALWSPPTVLVEHLVLNGSCPPSFDAIPVWPSLTLPQRVWPLPPRACCTDEETEASGGRGRVAGGGVLSARSESPACSALWDSLQVEGREFPIMPLSPLRPALVLCSEEPSVVGRGRGGVPGGLSEGPQAAGPPAWAPRRLISFPCPSSTRLSTDFSKRMSWGPQAVAGELCVEGPAGAIGGGCRGPTEPSRGRRDMISDPHPLPTPPPTHTHTKSWLNREVRPRNSWCSRPGWEGAFQATDGEQVNIAGQLARGPQGLRLAPGATGASKAQSVSTASARWWPPSSEPIRGSVLRGWHICNAPSTLSIQSPDIVLFSQYLFLG